MSSGGARRSSSSTLTPLETHPEQYEASSSGVNSDISPGGSKPTKRPSNKSRVSFNFLRTPSGGSSGSRRESFPFRKRSGSSEPPDSTGKYDGLRSEISANSSASQIRNSTRNLVKKLDRMAISSQASELYLGIGTLIGRLAAPPEAKVDEFDRKGRELEIILEAALGISEQLQVKFFDKHKEALKRDTKAQNLEAQNARIRTLNHRMFTTIAFYGDTGTGKSSLLNALLDNDYITPISNDATGTATPIEFRARDRGQNMIKKYTVIAESLTNDEWLPLAQRLLEDLQENPPGLAADSARQILKELFNLTEDGPVILADIMELPLNNTGPAGISKRFETQDLSRFQEHIEKLNTYYWSVLKRITIYMDSPVLNTGVILVDLPGLRDINPRKMELAKSYLENCETIFIVSNISRAVNNVNHLLTDPMIEPIVRRAQLDNSSTISFILTQTDNISITRNNPNWNKRQAIQERIEKTREQFRSSPHTQICNADVFCVSSLEYQWSQKRLIDPNAIPCLSASDSGIPDLRIFIQKKGLRQREAIIKTIVEGNMKTFLNSVRWWCENRETAPTDVFVFEELEKKINVILSEKAWKPLAGIIKGLEAAINEEAIEQAASEAADISSEWHNLKPNQFKAVCSRGGWFKNKDGDTFQWNIDLATPLQDTVTETWESNFDHSPDDPIPKAPQIFESLVDLLQKEIRDSMRGVDLNNELNSELLAGMHKQIADAVRTEEKEWRTSLLKFYAIFTDKNQSILGQKMSPVYKQCEGITGKGTQNQRRIILQNSVFDVVLRHYTELCNEVIAGLGGLMSNLQETLAEALRLVLDTVKAHFSNQVTDIKDIDLSIIKGELLGLSKIMEELEQRASRPRSLEFRS